MESSRYHQISGDPFYTIPEPKRYVIRKRPLRRVSVKNTNFQGPTRYIVKRNGVGPCDREAGALEEELREKVKDAALSLKVNSWTFSEHGIEVKLATSIDVEVLKNELHGRYRVQTVEENVASRPRAMKLKRLEFKYLGIGTF